MKIRKHWKKFLLTLTALFWASCSSDNDSNVSVANSLDNGTTPDASIDTGFTGAAEVLYGVPSDTIIDTIYVEDSIYTESSSGTVQSSSSDGTKTFKLASDPNATCKMTGSLPTGSCIEFAKSTSTKSSEPSQLSLRYQLQTNTTKTLEELEEIEAELENTPDFSEVALYGVQTPSCMRYNFKETFECSNDSTYTTFADSSGTHILRGSTIYSREEYDQKFSSKPKTTESSSSAVPESSSSAEPPSPLCTKNDFIDADKLREKFNSDKAAIIDSVKQTADTTANACLDSIPSRESIAAIKGLVARQQICDGDTIVNPRYQAKLDSNNAFVKEMSENCLKDPE